jgi:hypothetical protein
MVWVSVRVSSRAEFTSFVLPRVGEVDMREAVMSLLVSIVCRLIVVLVLNVFGP